MIPRNLRSGQRLKVYFCMLAPREMPHPMRKRAEVPMIQTYVQTVPKPGSG